ncbi:AAA family ATPase [uncultured Amnibacterium sp.]|uniref:AAA family ATPase n=1 Tax=uncultured Amnibacterium sp. TaxID=1631851 RepID=UPI0035CBB61B
MRLHRLEIAGFGPFRARQVVDFDRLAEDGIFLITGRTGAGKSSILDAVCFALYGGIPRSGPGDTRLRSDYSAPDEPSEVVLQLQVRGERYRVTRRPEYERPSRRRGGGLTRQPHEAVLERWQNDSWVGLAARPVDVAQALAPILQLTEQQFLQVVLLAQNRFQEFLRARSEDRQTVLRALFGTERFEQVQELLHERDRAAAAAVQERTAELDALLAELCRVAGAEMPSDAGPAWAEQVATAAALAQATAAGALAAADARFRAADAALRDAEVLAGLQRRREQARSVLQLAQQQRELRAALAVEADDAERAARVRPALLDRDRAAHDHAAAVTVLLDAEAAAGGADIPDAAARVSALDLLLGGLDEVLAVERSLPATTAAVRQAQQAHDAEQQTAHRLDDRGRQIPAERQSLIERLARLAATASRLPELATQIERATAVADAAGDAEQVQVALRFRLDDERRAAAASAAATAELADLLRRRMDGAAAILAASLLPETPCPVCGSVEHPAPATGAAPVNEDELERARARDDTARRRLVAAGEASRAASAASAEAIAAAGGLSAADAAVALEEIRDRFSAADDAHREVDRLQAQLLSLDDELAGLRTQQDTARLALERTAQALTAARTTLDTDTARVMRARGARGLGGVESEEVEGGGSGAPSVAQRVATLREERARVAALVAARRGMAEATVDRDREQRRLQQVLGLQGFADADAARHAERSEQWREAALTQLADWQQAVVVAAAVLAEPEVAAAAEVPAQVDSARGRRLAALGERDVAARTADAAERAARDAAALVPAVHDASEALETERRAADVVRSLARTVRGEEPNSRRMRLESYVLAAQLEQIIAAANTRLRTMTGGHYALAHDDGAGWRNTRAGLGLVVVDEHTGRSRPTASLSGGETFLAALALALGLAAVVSEQAGGVRLDTLFVDEGFGSLDDETLHVALSTLDELRAGGRLVGLISHVGTMQEDVPAGLHVERTADGSSVIHLRGEQGLREQSPDAQGPNEQSPKEHSPEAQGRDEHSRGEHSPGDQDRHGQDHLDDDRLERAAS